MRFRSLLILLPAACSSGATERPAMEPASLGKLRAAADYLVPSGSVTFSPAELADRRSEGARSVRVVVPAAQAQFTLEGECAPVRWAVAGPATATVMSPAPALAPPATESPAPPPVVSARITFEAPGDYLVTAACGGSRRQLAVSLCDFEGAIADAVEYYGTSIDFTGVRVSFEPTLLGQSWTSHNHVRIGGAWMEASAGCPPSSHYVHEFGHVWEHQHGRGQLARGAVDQLVNLVTDVYDFGGAEGIRAAVAAGRKLDSFNLEQQAEIFAADFLMRMQPDDPYAQDLATLTRPALAAKPTNTR